MGASFEERRMKLLRMIALRKAIERAEKAYEALRGDALADALARVDKVEAHAAEVAAERDAARDAAELAEGTVAALRDRIGELEAIIAGRTTPPTDAEIEAVSGETDDGETPEALMGLARVAVGAAESVLKGWRRAARDGVNASAGDRFEVADGMAGTIRLCMQAMEYIANAAAAISNAADDHYGEATMGDYREELADIAHGAVEYTAAALSRSWAAESDLRARGGE